MSKAFRAVFQRMVQRAWPLPVGSRDVIAMYTHFSAACSLGKWPRALTARRILAFTDSIALVVQTMRRRRCQPTPGRASVRKRLAQSSRSPEAPASRTRTAIWVVRRVARREFSSRPRHELIRSWTAAVPTWHVVLGGSKQAPLREPTSSAGGVDCRHSTTAEHLASLPGITVLDLDLAVARQETGAAEHSQYAAQPTPDRPDGAITATTAPPRWAGSRSASWTLTPDHSRTAGPAGSGGACSAYRLHQGQSPPLVRPPVSQRTTFQLPFQPGNLHVRQQPTSVS